MRLSDILRKECIEVGVSLKSKDEALERAAGLAAASSVLEQVPEEELLKALREREELGSTGFGNGLAIPHCRVAGAPDFVVGLMTVPEGVDFDALDGELVRIIAFIVGPEEAAAEHLRVLSSLSIALNTPGRAERILAASSPQEVYEAVVEHAESEVDLKGHTSKRLFHVFVQDEDVFRYVLEVFESLDGASFSVVEGKNAGEYLARVPLFAGFFTDEYGGFNQLILAVVDRDLTNEAIRRLEGVTGSLDERRDILVTVQDIFYAAGNLEV